MPQPGDIVTVDFQGATGIKRRPAVVVSSDLYHANRPDLIVAVLTTQIASAIGTLDYALEDWSKAGLHKPTAFRPYFNMVRPADVTVIGHTSDRDWPEIQSRLALILATKPSGTNKV